MSLLALLFPLFASGGINDVNVYFQFLEMKPGKPTHAYYYYDVTVSNNSPEAVYVVLPNWFGEKIPASAKVDAAQQDTYGTITGYRLFANATVSIFKVGTGEKLIIPRFVIETFDEALRSEVSTEIPVLFCREVTVGNHPLEHFMENDRLHDAGLSWSFDDIRQDRQKVMISNKE